MIKQIETYLRAKAIYESLEPPRTPNNKPISFDEARSSRWMSARYRLQEAYDQAREEADPA